MGRPINLLVVHCSATRATADLNAYDIDRMHKARGWKGCGYHYVITRRGGLQGAFNGFPCRPIEEIGAHVEGHNSNSIGICLIGGLGNTGQGEFNYTERQMNRLRGLLVDLSKLYPDAKICGHRDLSPDKDHDGKVEPHEWVKLCPCFDVAEWWKG